MKWSIGWLLMVLMLSGWQCAFAEEPVVEIDAAKIVPPLAYGESIFEQRSNAINIGDVIGGKTGYIHPYLAIGEFYTSNFFERENNVESEYVTRITPGIWVSLPASPHQLVRLNTLNVAPGGLELSRFRTKGKTRLQAYGSYQADILRHDRFNEEDQVNQKAEGFFRYNFRGGLSVDLLNVYELEHDSAGSGPTRSLDKFTSNLLGSTVSYEISSKTRTEIEYAWYTLQYDDDASTFRDRDDHRLTGRAFYRFMPKTSTFIEYNFIDIDYDENVLSSSKEHQAFLGLQWRQTIKSRWRAMVGYGKKDFDDDGIDDANNFLSEIQFSHRFTPKTYVDLRGNRRTNETDSGGGEYILSHKLQLRYFQRLTAKFLASLNLFYQNDEYKGDNREDDYYGGGCDLKYTLTRWLNLAGGYSFIERDSNTVDNDYDKHSVYLNLVASF
ncbi:hypothetical protein A7E78_03195 [Syntrophotalea acetylenivorans]|uniref:Capsular polysaccharide synthesis enzyme CpsB n=1 Tax=Syntrophotalea acetylenivorans TaxID=1842532 RepID=A0A1L3GLV5_9BACT|nr:outer membrane beta-barrel protein [Syntrophotalea acetylenivorans]APG26926.1 hypothetical protein A7E78_03195 [Syntrophotalea acetylenivorans]